MDQGENPQYCISGQAVNAGTEGERGAMISRQCRECQGLGGNYLWDTSATGEDSLLDGNAD